jgi:hypothetical protein
MHLPRAARLTLVGVCLLLLSTACTYPGCRQAIEADDTLAETPPLQGRFARHPSSFGKDPDLQLLRAAQNRLESGDTS